MNIQPPYGFMSPMPNYNNPMLPNDFNQPYNMKLEEIENRLLNLEKRIENLEKQKDIYHTNTYNPYPNSNMQMI